VSCRSPATPGATSRRGTRTAGPRATRPGTVAEPPRPATSPRDSAATSRGPARRAGGLQREPWRCTTPRRSPVGLGHLLADPAPASECQCVGRLLPRREAPGACHNEPHVREQHVGHRADTATLNNRVLVVTVSDISRVIFDRVLIRRRSR
jgi:hypothetical protein